jgi:recombinational DNA repair protein (RecF pathway)
MKQQQTELVMVEYLAVTDDVLTQTILDLLLDPRTYQLVAEHFGIKMLAHQGIKDQKKICLWIHTAGQYVNPVTGINQCLQKESGVKERRT